jgi:DNA-directed RNA polymerase specialized sigma24 family protein
MSNSKPTYTAVARRYGDWWAVDVPKLKGVRTQARRLEHVIPMAADAIALTLDVPEDSFDIVLKVALAEAAGDVLAQLATAKDELARAQKGCQETFRSAAEVLVHKEGLTVRDAGRILGVSYQRVAQLLHS